MGEHMVIWVFGPFICDWFQARLLFLKPLLGEKFFDWGFKWGQNENDAVKSFGFSPLFFMLISIHGFWVGIFLGILNPTDGIQEPNEGVGPN